MYEVPKISVPVNLHLINDETIPGKLFISGDQFTPDGHPDISQFLNEEPTFFFSYESDAGAYRLINKHQLVFLETDQDDTEIKQRTPLTPKSLVLHFRNDTTLFGTVYPTTAEASRVSDLLNEDSDFLTVYRQGQKIIVNRAQIVYVNAN
ncbi:MAG: hypothetical protein AAF525_10750 [Pseudomonadota bacterium]